MKVLKKAKQDTVESFYNESYEYRLCGGAVEPKDRKQGKADEKQRR